MDAILEEMQAIEAIYCGENEFTLLSQGESSVIFSVTITPSSPSSLKITLTFTLSSQSYPQEVPPFSLQCTSVSRKECRNLTETVRKEAELYKGSPMVLSILTCLQDMQIITQDTLVVSSFKDTPETKMYILQLDHMRNKTRYVKTIERWCKELKIMGCLVFCLRWIFIILQGDEDSIKTYIQRNKTQVVDVDSSGRPCKERLLSLLHSSSHHIVFQDFCVCNFESVMDFKNYLITLGLVHIYESIILPIVHK